MEKNLKSFVAGFDLAGERKADGLLHSYTDPEAKPVKEFPEEIELFGRFYEKEGKTIKGKDGYESVQYC